MERCAWFCPACNAHHAPHVNTCPNPASLPFTAAPYRYTPEPVILPPSPVFEPWPPMVGDPMTPVIICSTGAQFANAVTLSQCAGRA
jgi:hypothetical protein